MVKGPKTGLIAEGSVSQSWVSRLPGLRRNLGPVMGLSLRNASRVVNMIKCGVATDSCAEMRKCELILICVPDAELAKWVDNITASFDSCPKVGFVCCSEKSDSGALEKVRELGASVGSLSEMEGFSGKRYLYEGDNIVLHRLRRLIEEDGTARIVEMGQKKRAVYAAGLSFASGMTFPMISAAVDTMRAAGLDGKVAESAVEAAVTGAVRAYLRAGRRGWAGPVAKADRDELKRQYDALFEVDEDLAEMYLKIALDYLVEVAARPRNNNLAKSGT
jgi:predicted short-subunit dehydrogenase-like oxidoreductase (DUF2520 family)